jgi:Flp pilus assembly protein TadB
MMIRLKSYRHSAFRNPQSAIRNPQSEIGMMIRLKSYRHSAIRIPKSEIELFFLLKPLIMRTLHVLLFFILSIFWQPSAAFATVQTVQTTVTATTQQATPKTMLKQSRLQKKIQQWSAYRGSRFDMSDHMMWLYYGLGFLVVAWLISRIGVSLLSLIAGIIGIVAIVCLVVWVLKVAGLF